MEVRLWNLQRSFRNEFSILSNPWNATKGLRSRTCWLSLLNRQKIKVAEQKWHSTFLRAKHFYFHEQHLFSCVNPIHLCYRMLNMGRIAIFGHFLFIFFVFDRRFGKGHSHLTKWNFDSVEIWSFLINFYGIHFISKVCPWSKIEKFDFFHVKKCWEITRHFLAFHFVMSYIVTSIWCHIVEDATNTFGTDSQ